MNRQVLLVYAVELIRNCGIFIVGPFVVLYLRSLDIPIITIGMLFSLKGTFDVILSLPIGHLSDTWGRKPWIILSPLLTVMTYFLFIISRSIIHFVFVFVLWNISELSWNYSVPIYLNDIVENKGRGDALAKLSLMNTVASIAGPVVAGVTAELYGIPSLFMVGMVTEGVILGIVMYWTRLGFSYRNEEVSVQDIEIGGKSEGIRRFLSLLKGNILYFCLAMMVMSFAWAFLDIATPLFLKEELGISYLGFGTVMSIIGIMGAGAKVGVGRFTDIHGRKGMLLFSTVTAGIFMISIGMASSELQFIILRGGSTIFGACMWIAWMASFHDTIVQKRATISALIDTLSGITWAIGSLSVGVVLSLITARSCFFLIGAVYVATALIFSRIRSF
jgi:MFS family permease